MEEDKETTAVSSCVRGYKDVWDPIVGETLACRQESGNVQDTVVVVRTDVEAEADTAMTESDRLPRGQ